MQKESESIGLCKDLVYAAFCGTGKSYLCSKFPNICQEIECWEYRGGNFPNNYIRDVLNTLGKTKYLFISTDPVILKGLNKLGIRIHLIYPQNELKEEYHNRYRKRGSHVDFIDAYDRYWDTWLNELKEQDYCKHTLLNSGEYLRNIIPCKAEVTDKLATIIKIN